MKLKNIEVEAFATFIMSIELKGRESRLRTRFARILIDRQRLIQEENFELIKQYANLDEEGNPKQVEREGQLFFDVTDRISYNKEYFLLMNEDFVIEENEERKEMLLLIKDIILNCEMTFKGEEALKYDHWCEIVENINYDEE